MRFTLLCPAMTFRSVLHPAALDNNVGVTILRYGKHILLAGMQAAGCGNDFQTTIWLGVVAAAGGGLRHGDGAAGNGANLSPNLRANFPANFPLERYRQ